MYFPGEDPIHVSWFKDDEYLPDCKDFEYMNYGNGEFGLRLRDTFLDDTGTYQCQAYNCHGDAHTLGHLIVKSIFIYSLISYVMIFLK